MSNSNFRQLPPELDAQILPFLSEKFKDSEPEILETEKRFPLTETACSIGNVEESSMWLMPPSTPHQLGVR